MTHDNEVTREKTFSEELPYFKEQMKDAFEMYTNSDGHIDVVDISLLIDTKRILRKAEEEINRQQAEIERLTKETMNMAATIETCQGEAIKEFAERLKEKQQTFTGDEYAYKFIYLIEIDNLVKEMVVE